MEGDHGRAFAVGIDLGTTSVKVSAVDLTSGIVVESKSRSTNADVPSDIGAAGFEQDVSVIVSTVEELLAEVGVDIMHRTRAVAVTGQMHGVVLWSGATAGCLQNNARLQVRNVSRLITWQDQRCTDEFLATLPPPRSSLRLATGHGCATLFWLQKNRPGWIEGNGYDCAGTVMDFLTSAIAGQSHPVTSDQLAASFGYFSMEHGNWNTDLLESHGFPVKLLPEVRAAGSVMGQTAFPWCNIPQGAAVLAGLGDLQCAVTSVLDDHVSAVLNISTSLQLAVPVMGPEKGEGQGEMKAAGRGDGEGQDRRAGDTGEGQVPSAVELLPYLEERRLAVAASLNGGNVLAHLVRTLRGWLQDLGVEVPESTVWASLIGQAERDDVSDTLHVQPLLYGERHLKGATASVSGIRADNSSLGAVFRATCRGLVENLHSMMDHRVLKRHGVSRILATGSVVMRVPLVLHFVRQFYITDPSCDLEVDLAPTSADSAFGAAKVAALALKNLTI